MTAALRRPAFRYYGGKWLIAPWLISYFPAHRVYAELCGGAASVLLRKSPAFFEVYNDLDESVVNFFRVLRERPDELVRQLRLTPYARAEYELSKQPADDPLERARRFAIGATLSISGNPHKSGFRRLVDTREGVLMRHIAPADHLYQIAERLINVQIENTSYQDIVDRYDAPDTLFYFDPPYVSSERTKPNEYNLDWTDADHEEAAGLLNQCTGYVIVSGYACPLYASLYEKHGWRRVDKEAVQTNGRARVESLWINPRAWTALHDLHSGLPLFERGDL